MPRLNSVGAKFIIALALILPIFVWQLGKDAFQSFQRYQDISSLERQNAAANSLIAGVYEILMERLATNNALQASSPPIQPFLMRSKNVARLRSRRLAPRSPILVRRNSPTRPPFSTS
jgi:hypothetical protein